MKALSIIRVKRSEYIETIDMLSRKVEQSEDLGDKARANIIRRLIVNYQATGNPLIEAGTVNLEIIED